MAFKTKNRLLPPNLSKATSVIEVFVPQSARVTLNGWTSGATPGYSGCITISEGENPKHTQVNIGDTVVLRYEKRFPTYQVVTGI